MTREPEVALFAALCLGAVGCSSAVEGRADGGSTDGQDGSTSMSPEPEPSSSDATSGGSSDGSDPTTSSGFVEGSSSEGGESSTSGDTTGSSPQCVDDPTACSAWILPVGATEWEPIVLDPDSPLAPRGVVRAAFAVDATNEGFVLTDTQVHVVDLTSRQWTRVELRNDVFPDAVGDLLTSANAVPAFHAGDPNVASVTLLSTAAAYVYALDVTTGAFTVDQLAVDYDANWNELAPDVAEIRASWVDVTNARGWFDADLQALCGVAAEPGPYGAYITAYAVHVHDAGYCFEFDAPQVYADFLPLTYPNAPAPARVGASFQSEEHGLWILAENP